ncbi:MAG: SGNH/GDSL hydrolase family protein [Acidobacteria bacterium]|nr:SGNH/GDSL hydrolase family protein [Acidobacteriota bacterium]
MSAHSLVTRWIVPALMLSLVTTGCGESPTQPPTGPRLLATNIVAFGDSMTAGENGREGTSDPVPASTSCLPGGGATASSEPQFRTFFIDAKTSYPTSLQSLLQAVFPRQQISVANEGNPGESSDEGATRLPCVLTLRKPQALAILEGVNDLAAGGTSDITLVVAALEAALTKDIAAARAAGVTWIYLVTIPPPGVCSGTTPCRARTAADITRANDVIRTVAQRTGVPLIDAHLHFVAAGAQLSTLIDTDGLHLTPAGYTLIAQSLYVQLPVSQ